MLDLAKHLSIWRTAGVQLIDGVSRESVIETFREIGWDATPDVIEMYAQIGGMPEMDSELWRLWPLLEVKAENSAKSVHGVYFSDYLVSCWQFLLVPNGRSSAVFRDNFDGSEPYQVAESLEVFFAKYLSNPGEVLESIPKGKRRDA